MRHYNMVNQKEKNDCAVACLMMILKYYKIKVNYEKLKKELRTNEEGTTAYDIINTSKKYGLSAIGYKKYNVDKIKEPVIALVLNNDIQHFIVIYKVKKNSIIIADPTSKIMTISKIYFKKYYTGIIIKFINKRPSKYNYLLIFCYFIINVLIIIQNLIILFVVYKIINIIEMKNYLLIIKYAILFILLYVLKSTYIYIKDIFSLKIRIMIDKTVTLPFISKLLSSNNSKETNIVDDLVGKYHDLNYIKDMYFKFISVYLIDLLFLFFSLITLFIINNRICIVLLIYLLINFLFNYMYFSKNYFRILDNQVCKEKYLSKIVNVFNNKSLKKQKVNYYKIKKEYNNFIFKTKEIEKSFIFKNFISDILYLTFLIIAILVICNFKNSFSNIFYLYSLIMIIVEIMNNFIYELPNFMSYKAIKERIINMDIK